MGSMRVLESRHALKRARRTAWEFQRTFLTPLKDLPRFVGVILSALPGVKGAHAEFDQVVFEPQYELVPLAAKYSLPPDWHRAGLAIEAEGATETRELLQAVLSESIDFLFVPTPKRFVVYADHHECMTFFAHRKGHLNAVAEALTVAKFVAVEYTRAL